MHSRGCVTTAGSDVTAKRAPPTPAVSPRPPLSPHEAPKVPSVLGADLSWTVHARGLTQHVFAVALHGAWCSPGSAVFQPVSRLSSWLWLNSGPLSSKTCSREHTTALATTIKWWKQPRCPSTVGGSIIWVRAGQDQSRAEVRAGQGSEQGRIRAGLGSEQDRGDRVLSPGCSGKSMGQARGRNSRAGAGQASNPRRVGVWLQLPPRGAPLPERRECRPLPPAPAPAWLQGDDGSQGSHWPGHSDPGLQAGPIQSHPCPGLGVGVSGRPRARLMPSAPGAPRK